MIFFVGIPTLATELLQNVRGQASEAQAALEDNERNISTTCENHTRIFLDALQSGDDWALLSSQDNRKYVS